MPYDRRPSAKSGRPQRSGRPTAAGGARGDGGRSARPSSAEPRSGRPVRPAARTGRPSANRGADAESGSGSAPRRSGPPRRDPRAARTVDGERPRRYDSTRSPAGGRDRVPPRRVEPPRTAAQIRSAEVKAARGVREPRQPVQPAPWEKETWIDDGPLRSAARKATARAQRTESTEPAAAPKGRRRSLELAPQVADDLQRVAPAVTAAKYQERLATAADALDRGRFDDARRMVQPVLRDLPRLAFGHEIAGLAWYRTGQWRKAAAE